MALKKMNYHENYHLFHDTQGRRVFTSLFKEHKRDKVKFEPPFTIVQWKEIYMEVADPTEYQTMLYLVGDWEHYTQIRNHPKIKPVMDLWAMELEVKLRSKAVMNMVDHASRQGGTAAAKWLADGDWKGESKKTKMTRDREAEVKEEVKKTVTSDLERLGLRVVEGGK
jgi:hypothetical protein